MDNEELIRLLKKTKKMSNKYLAKRIDRVDDLDEQMRINNKVYDLFISLLSDESKENLIRLDNIIILLCNRLYNNSNWEVGDDYSFIKGNNKVIRTKEGYVPSNKDNSLENNFIWNNDILLGVLNDVLNEREQFLLNDYKLNDENDRELAYELIRYLGYSDKENNLEKR